MTQTITPNINNDLFIGTDGNLAVSSGINAVEWACQSAAKAQLNEMVYAYDQGVAYFQTIWTDGANVAQFESSLRNAITNVDGVVSISEFSVLVENDQLSYSMTINTEFGQGFVNGTVSINSPGA